MSLQKETINKIKEALSTLKYYEDMVTITGVCPCDIEEYFNIDVVLEGGRDFDYYASTDKYSINGSAFYGKVEITLTVGKERPNEEETNNDIYTRTSFVLHGQTIKNVKPVVECDDETRDSLVAQGILHQYYICFSSRGETTLYPFYAKSENDVRLRALSIWGSYDDIMTKEKVEELQNKYLESFARSYHISTIELTLC